jgi:hypothetical protein
MIEIIQVYPSALLLRFASSLTLCPFFLTHFSFCFLLARCSFLGDIDKMELAAVLEDLGVLVTQERLDNAFEKLDINNDGSISFEEFAKWWRGDTVRYTLKRSEEIQPRNRYVSSQGKIGGATSMAGGGNGGRENSSPALTGKNATNMSTIPEETTGSYHDSRERLGRSATGENALDLSQRSLSSSIGGGAAAVTNRLTQKMTSSRSQSMVLPRFGRQVGCPISLEAGNRTKLEVTDLIPNSLYHFKVRYVGSRSNSLLSAACIVMTAPLPPSLPAMIDLTCNTVRVKWYPSLFGAYKFIVQMRQVTSVTSATSQNGAVRRVGASLIGTDIGEDGWIQVYNGFDNVYTNTMLSTELSYELRVFSVNYYGTSSSASPSLVFTTLSRNDTSNQITAKTIGKMFDVECTGDICVGDTILITERLYLRPKQGGEGDRLVSGGNGGIPYDSNRSVRGSITSLKGGKSAGGRDEGRASSRGKTRPSSASATGRANNPLGASVTSLVSHATADYDGFVSINPSSNAEYIGDRTYAAIVIKDNYRTSRDIIESKGIDIKKDYQKFTEYRKIWLQIVWSKSALLTIYEGKGKKYELKPDEILERNANHLELFEVFRCRWKHENNRKSFVKEWELLKDCYIEME